MPIISCSGLTTNTAWLPKSNDFDQNNMETIMFCFIAHQGSSCNIEKRSE